MNPVAAAAAPAIESASKSKATPYIVGGIVIVGLGLTIFVTMKILEALNLKYTRKEKKDIKASEKLTTDQSFDPIHARNRPSRVTLSNQRAEQLARTIYTASGWVKAKEAGRNLWGLGGRLYDDDEAALYGAVRDAGTTYNLSKVADVFFKKYKVGMLDFIDDFTNESERAKVKKIVDNFKS